MHQKQIDSLIATSVARVVSVAILFGTILIGCTEIDATSLPPETIDNRFSLTGMRWQDGTIMPMAVKVSNNGDKTAVCGAWALPNSASYAAFELVDEVLASADIKVTDDVVATTASFFSQARFTGASLPTGKASCVLTTTPWKPVYATARPKFVLYRRMFVLVD